MFHKIRITQRILNQSSHFFCVAYMSEEDLSYIFMFLFIRLYQLAVINKNLVQLYFTDNRKLVYVGTVFNL